MIILEINGYDDWRSQARYCIHQHMAPHLIEWREITNTQNSLFSENSTSPKNHVLTHKKNIVVPSNVMKLTQKISYHRDSQKWSLLYTLVWRIVQGERNLLLMRTDPIVHKLYLMFKAVSRDIHKMKAFVRFTNLGLDEQEYFVAWYEPDHKIIQSTAPFFQKRFSSMRWSIYTPDGAAHWDKNKLYFSTDDTITNKYQDATIDLWQTYYRSIFNPARIKLKAMRREMPQRFWKCMPETKIISNLLIEAPQRVAAMLKYTEGFAADVQSYMEDDKTIAGLSVAAAKCQACPLHECATQTVFGSGYDKASLMLLGEQPGDIEDQTGIPFVGPAGQILNRALNEANINRNNLYLTNAVKHFKFKTVNGKRIHRSPNVREINTCKSWLEAEIAVVQPKVILCMGLTAVRAIFSHNLNMKKLRGKCFEYNNKTKLVITYHPSAILRIPQAAQRNELYHIFLNDIIYANNLTK